MSGIAIAAVVGFALGAIPFSWVLARLVGGLDIRAVGSGNVGATNVARNLGWGPGTVALLLDAAKGSAAVLLGPRLAPESAPQAAIAAGGMAVLGHMFSPFMGFKGGKGVATGAGVFAFLAPWPLLAAVGVFAIVLVATRMVSAGSIAASATLPLFALGLGAGREVALVAAIVGALVIVRHRANIARILGGGEPRVGGRPGGAR